MASSPTVQFALNSVVRIPVVIPEAGTDSDLAQIPPGRRLVGLSIRAGFTGTNLVLLGSTDMGETVGRVWDFEADVVGPTVAADDELRHIPMPHQFFEMFTHVGVRADEQGGEAIIELVFR